MTATTPGMIFVIIVSVFLNAGAQILLSVNLKGKTFIDADQPVHSVVSMVLNPGIIGAMAVYGVSILLWMYVLTRTNVSLAYPFLGLGFAFVALIGFFFLGEPLGLQKSFGILAVAIGIVLLAWS